MQKIYRVGIIGSTGKGNYGHGLDTAFSGLDGVELAAIADADPEGLAAAGQRLGIDRRYADYRQMLEAEKLDVVSIGPGWVTERVPMVEAAAAAGCHIYSDKLAAGSLRDVDAIVAACERGGVEMALAHQWRAMPPVQKVIAQVRAGQFGRLLRMRARPKDDSRGGGEELLLHGTHLFDLMMALAGAPRWASGHIAVGRRDATRADRRQGNSPVGPIIGDSISAMFGFDEGVRGFFESTADLAVKSSPSGLDGANLFGLSLECEWASLELREAGQVFVYAAPRVLPDQAQLQWEQVWQDEWPAVYTAEQVRKSWLAIGNKILARDLLDAIEEGRPPLSSIRTVRLVNEMVQGVYASHLSGGGRVTIPLSERAHPLGD